MNLAFCCSNIYDVILKFVEDLGVEKEELIESALVHDKENCIELLEFLLLDLDLTDYETNMLYIILDNLKQMCF